jgi:hypothetical protein
MVMGIYSKQRSLSSLYYKYKINILKIMPRFDGTGPMGYGPGTGKGMGPCGCGMGWGRGCGRMFYTKKEESEMLKDEETALEEELKAVKERLAEISK